MNKYLFMVRPTLEGPMVDSWYKILGDEKADKNILFAMTLRARLNPGSGILVMKSKEEWSSHLMNIHLQSMNQKQFKKFIKDSALY